MIHQETVIRVGEKNNFNMTKAELTELERYTSKGLIFVNSNSFTEVNATFPSIITINPYMRFQKITGDLSNIKAVRIKVYKTDFKKDIEEQIKCIEFCIENNLPILLTYMRFRSKKTVLQYSGEKFRDSYEWKGSYFRPTVNTKQSLYVWVESVIDYLNGDFELLNECDSLGGGCPDCMNCTFLTYGIKSHVTIKALNLSISGIKDKNGNRGLCQYKCPDCFAKIVTFGKRPQCDKLITNAKITGYNKK